MPSRQPVQIGAAAVYHGDCLAIAPTIGQVDAIVCDPPYGLKFMNSSWDDGIAFRPETWAALGEPLKPGGYLLAFGGSRTHHRIWCAIEDAGFVIQDTIMWIYGQGFPKGRTQLKPAFEPICVAYKPAGKRSMRVDECRVPTELGDDSPRKIRHNNVSLGSSGSGIYGKGKAFTSGGQRTLQVDECRIPTDESLSVLKSFNKGSQGGNPGYNRPWNTTGEKHSEEPNTKGRWPANVCHDGSDEVMEAFGVYDDGSPSRFFYNAKAGKADRAGSKHPTVKPVALMQWLVRLVTPPGGTVLDPFAGSGTTAAAALAEGRRVILIEREPEYIADIERRLKACCSMTEAA